MPQRTHARSGAFSFRLPALVSADARLSRLARSGSAIPRVTARRSQKPECHGSRESVPKAVELQLTYRAETSPGSARLTSGGGYWLHETEAAGDDAPALLIFYKIERARVIPDWIELAP